MPPVKKSNRKRAARQRKNASRRVSKGLRCPDCDFVAQHPMGLGRHRSSRHGVVSQRQARRDAEGGWITRQEAARRAGVHYNTIRHWEQAGKIRTSKRAGYRGSLVNASDLMRIAGGGTRTTGLDSARIQALEQRFNELLAGLERLVSSARGRAHGRTRRSS